MSLNNRELVGDNSLILYTVSSSYLERDCCSLVAFGHNRDGKTVTKQITFGLLCAKTGCPVAVEVLTDNTGRTGEKDTLTL